MMGTEGASPPYEASRGRCKPGRSSLFGSPRSIPGRNNVGQGGCPRYRANEWTAFAVKLGGTAE